MKKQKKLKKSLGKQYVYEIFVPQSEANELLNKNDLNSQEIIINSLTAGCLRIITVIYSYKNALILGYDVYVKDKPNADEWICYDNLSVPVGNNIKKAEKEMFLILDEYAKAHGLSYTECNYETIIGKRSRKS